MMDSMIYQIHQHFDNGEIKVFGQAEINNRDDWPELNILLDNLMKDNPLPEDAKWFVCKETAPCFYGVKK